MTTQMRPRPPPRNYPIGCHTIRQVPALTDEELARRVGFGQRTRAAHHWTPVAVIERACAMFGDACTILDVGAGIGKLCLVGAQLLPDRHFVGIERDAACVATAQRLARELGLAGRTTFIHGDVLDHAWEDHEALYLFNPFTEARLVPSRRDGHAAELVRAGARLTALRPGTRVVTYHGAGFPTPELELLACEEPLCAWARA